MEVMMTDETDHSFFSLVRCSTVFSKIGFDFLYSLFACFPVSVTWLGFGNVDELF